MSENVRFEGHHHTKILAKTCVIVSLIQLDYRSEQMLHVYEIIYKTLLAVDTRSGAVCFLVYGRYGPADHRRTEDRTKGDRLRCWRETISE